MKGTILLFIVLVTFGDADSQEICLTGDCKIEGTQIVETVGSFHNSWHAVNDQEVFGTTCKTMVKGSFRESKWRWQGRFWCPALSTIEGHSISWKSREETVEHVVDDYMQKGKEKGFLTADQLENSSNIKSQLISSLFDLKIRQTRDLTKRFKRSFYTKKNQTRLYRNGVYHGDVVGDVMEGIGEFYWFNKDFYVGAWRNNTMHGLGVYYFKGGPMRYVGYYQNGERHGYGIMTYDNGSVYKGDFVDNERSGYGEQTWDDGDKYIGQFKNNERHGFGYWFLANGTKRAAFYYNGVEI